MIMLIASNELPSHHAHRSKMGFDCLKKMTTEIFIFFRYFLCQVILLFIPARIYIYIPSSKKYKTLFLLLAGLTSGRWVE
jgi:hypothetical protein